MVGFEWWVSLTGRRADRGSLQARLLMEGRVSPPPRLREGKQVGVPPTGLSRRPVFPSSTDSTCYSDHSGAFSQSMTTSGHSRDCREKMKVPSTLPQRTT